jgi:hypothetical protein
MRLLLASALLVLALAAAAAMLFVAHEERPDALVQAEVAGVKFVYMRAYARDDATGAGGLADRLSFMALFPGFTPVRAKDRAAPFVTVTVSPKDDGVDPRERPAKLYARFLTPETLDGPGGLVLRRFEQGSPYDSEELLIAPPDGAQFFARCPRPQNGAPDEACLTVFRDGALDVELRYPAILLEHWDVVIDGAHSLLAKIRASARKKTR